MQSTKRMKIGHEESSATEVLEHSKTINDLPTDLMKNIFSFVGKGNYCFVGPVSKDFCYNYLTFDLFVEKFAHKLDFLQAIGRNKITTPVAASTSFELAEHCFFYAPDDFNRQILTKAALNGRQDIVTLGHAMGVKCFSCLEKTLLEITKRGDLEMLQLLYHKYRFLVFDVFRQAAFYGHIDILNWVKPLSIKRGIGLGTAEMACLFESAAEGGQQEVIEWLKVTVEDITGYPFDRRNNPHLDFSDYLESTARGGHLELLKWFSEGEDDALRDVNILYNAVRSGNMELIKYLVDSGCPYDSSRLCIAAVYIGDHVKSLEILTFLHRLGVPWDESTCCEAAFRCNLNFLIYARENGCLWDEKTLEEAVKKGNLPIVEYCLQNNCPISTENCSLAVSHKDHDHALKLLKLLRKYSAPWNEKTCSNAAMMQNLKALQWARSSGCPWDTKTFEYAMHAGNIAMIEYCLKNNCPTEDVDILVNVFHDDNELSILKILQNNGYTFTEKNCSEALEEEDIKALRWLRYNGCPWDDNLCGKAVQLNNCEALEFVNESGCPLTKETYAFCFGEDGLAGKYSEIPTEHECSDEILWYLQSKDCPRPDPSDWIITQDRWF